MEPRDYEVVNSIGNLYATLGETDKALKFYNEVAQLPDCDGNIYAAVNGNIAAIEYRRGKFQKAISHYQKSLASYINLGDLNNIAKTRSNMAMTYSDLKSFDTADKYFSESLSDYEIIENTEGKSETLQQWGISFRERGEIKQAKEHLLLALEMSQPEDSKKISSILYHLGNVYFHDSQPDKAITSFKKANHLNLKIKDQSLSVDINNSLSQAYISKKEPELSLEYANTALIRSKQTKNQSAEISALNNIARATSLQGNHTAAIKALKEVISISEDRNKVAALGFLGEAYHLSGRNKEAIKSIEECMELASAVGDINNYNAAKRALIDLYKLTGNTLESERIMSLPN